MRVLESRRYRQTSVILSPLFAVVYICHLRGNTRRCHGGRTRRTRGARIVRDFTGGRRTAVLLGSTLNFVSLLDRSAGRVSVHPYENVLAIESSAPRPPADAD